MRHLLLYTALISVAAVTAAAAEDRPIDEIVVTAARVPVTLRTVGSAIDVLTAEDIAARPRFEVADLLREIPGTAVNRSGGLGSLTQLRLRGAEADQTVVMIDGVQVGDPFNNSEFDFANLLTTGVDRIEVLRGPQSALYGAQAIGGVINIITAQGAGPAHLIAQAEGGSFGTYDVNSTLTGGGSTYGYGATAAYLRTEGVSQSRIQPEPDGHHNLTLNAVGHVDLTDTFTLDGSARYMNSFNKLDEQDFDTTSPTFGLVIDANDYQTTKTFSGHTRGRLKLLDGAWTNSLTLAYTSVHTRSYSAGALSFGSNGRKLDVVYQSDAQIGHGDGPITQAVTGAVEYRNEHFDSVSAPIQSRDQDTWGLVGEYRLTAFQQLYLTGSLRHDINQYFVNDTTFRLTSAWEIPNTPVKLRASYGTGVAKPTFYDLFGFDPTMFRGNPNLKPEKSQGWDVGTDVALGDMGLFSLSYFHANLRDEIFTNFAVFPATTANMTGISHREGVETALRYSPIAALIFAASYTYSKSLDATGAQEVRRPRNTASGSVTGKLLDDRLSLGASVDYNGDMTDFKFLPPFFTSVPVTLGSYALVTVNAAYDITEHVQVFGRIENLFNTDYQEVYSYNHLGRGAYGGVRVKL